MCTCQCYIIIIILHREAELTIRAVQIVVCLTIHFGSYSVNFYKIPFLNVHSHSYCSCTYMCRLDRCKWFIALPVIISKIATSVSMHSSMINYHRKKVHQFCLKLMLDIKIVLR